MELWIIVVAVAWVLSLMAVAFILFGFGYDKGYMEAKDTYTNIHLQRNEAAALTRRQATRHSLYEILKHAESLKGSLEKAIEENDS